jgi:competence protein ComEC
LTSAQFPDELYWGTKKVFVLNPTSGLINPETNEASLVLLLDDAEVEFLFTGDIDSAVESEIIARGTPVTADILKVAHHGSNYSSSANFLNAVQPFDSIISVGPNSYGHPGDETLARLAAIGSNIWRTDVQGTITVTTSDGINYVVIPSPDGNLVFLPMILRNYPAPTATPTEPPPNTGKVVITTIFYDGTGSQEPDEYVEIRNDDSQSIQLNGWTLSDEANHEFKFPAYVMMPGQVCRIYTNEDHPEWCGFNHSSGSAIWNNTGDCAYLRDASFALINEYCYP